MIPTGTLAPTPPGTATTTVALRAVCSEDDGFLREVYTSTRVEELAVTDWDLEQRNSFLRIQFDAQRRCYESDYPGAVFLVIEVAGRPAGRLYVHRRAGEIRIMDIALLPEYRRLGIGTRLLKEILSEGAQSGRPVTIHVEVFNPAQRLYERLGFRPVATNGIYRLLEWTPAPVSSGEGLGEEAVQEFVHVGSESEARPV